jgi:hypothetical protein
MNCVKRKARPDKNGDHRHWDDSQGTAVTCFVVLCPGAALKAVKILLMAML